MTCPPAFRQAADPLLAYLTGDGDARFVACHQPFPRHPRPARPCRAGSGVPAQHRHPARSRSGGRLPPSASSSTLIAKRIPSTSSTPTGCRTGMGRRINTDHADLFLRHFRHPARGEEAIAAITGRREDLRPQGWRSSNSTKAIDKICRSACIAVNCPPPVTRSQQPAAPPAGR